MTPVTPSPVADLVQPLFTAVSTALSAWSNQGALITASHSFAVLLNTTPSRLEGSTLTSIIHPEDLPAFQDRLARPPADIGTPTTPSFRLRLLTPGGDTIRTRSVVSPLEQDGRPLGYLLECIATGDILTELEHRDHQAAMYRDLFENSPDIVFTTGPDNRFVDVNPAGIAHTGYSLDHIRRLTPLDVTHPDDQPGAMEYRERRNLREQVSTYREQRIVRADGSYFWAGVSLRNLFDSSGRFLGSQGVARDITAIKQRESSLEQAALSDPLTGLGNRRAFDEAVEACLARVDSGEMPVLVLIDLDDLKTINDQAGHDVGDEAIRTVARALTERIRTHDQAFRIGGDEFALIIHGGAASMIEARLAHPIPFQEPFATLTISAGSATCGVDTHDPAEAFRLADARMFQVKHARGAAR